MRKAPFTAALQKHCEESRRTHPPEVGEYVSLYGPRPQSSRKEMKMAIKQIEIGELELIKDIASCEDPAQALAVAVEVITQFLNQQKSGEGAKA